eukprot:CAMPEP_0179211836 /NCGR_PEP_ID=MMETSP0797-20121207/719_1 /TAXON_ID=47934 /ORGANISM="Dinophysis acuminata, Strain DAEP01" /LENGTH=360 /DNA_ID=CAMNT_0020917277 /DNA_START=176 /DNA_END=1259 /DNA_ORIENTATION=-
MTDTDCRAEFLWMGPSRLVTSPARIRSGMTAFEGFEKLGVASASAVHFWIRPGAAEEGGGAGLVVDPHLLLRLGVYLRRLPHDPLVLRGQVRRNPILLVVGEHLAELVPREVRAVRPVRGGEVVPVRGEANHLRLFGVAPAVLAALPREAEDQQVHDDAARPDVTEQGVAAQRHLGGAVVGRAGLLLHDLVGFPHHAGCLEVNDLHDDLLQAALRLQHDVLRLHVPVAHHLFVHVGNPPKDLLQDVRTLALRVPDFLREASVQRAAEAEIEHAVIVEVVLECLVQFDDVRVLDERRYADHFHDGVGSASRLFQVDRLDRAHVLRLLVRDSPHAGECVSGEHGVVEDIVLANPALIYGALD